MRLRRRPSPPPAADVTAEPLGEILADLVLRLAALETAHAALVMRVDLRRGDLDRLAARVTALEAHADRVRHALAAATGLALPEREYPESTPKEV